MKKYILLLILIFVITSCTSPEETSNKKPTQAMDIDNQLNTQDIDNVPVPSKDTAPPSAAIKQEQDSEKCFIGDGLKCLDVKIGKEGTGEIKLKNANDFKIGITNIEIDECKNILYALRYLESDIRNDTLGMKYIPLESGQEARLTFICDSFDSSNDKFQSGFVVEYRNGSRTNKAQGKIKDTLLDYIPEICYAPSGYIWCIPKIDKVWPTWREQRARLSAMDEHPRLPVVGKPAEALEPMLRKMQGISWMVDNCIVVLDENSPVALRDMAVESRGQRWYAETKNQGNRPVVCGSTSIDKDTNRVRITLYGQDFNKERVLTEEVYHIVYEIIRHTNPKTFGLMKKWYCNQLKDGLDPTWHMHEAFAELMVRETESPESTGLPRRVVNYAQKIFSPACKIPSSVMEEIVAGV
jgi:hypothetical protein